MHDVIEKEKTLRTINGKLYELTIYFRQCRLYKRKHLKHSWNGSSYESCSNRVKEVICGGKYGWIRRYLWRYGRNAIWFWIDKRFAK